MTVDGKSLPVKDLGGGVIEIALAKGREVFLRCGQGDTAVRPLELEGDTHNYWGVKQTPQRVKAVAPAFLLTPLHF